MTTNRLRIGLYGHLGVGNLGNEASSGAGLDAVRRIVPGAEVICFATDPATVTAEHGVPARAARWHRRRSTGLRSVDRLLDRVGTKLADLAIALRMVRGCDAVVVPGMGQFEGLAFGVWQRPYGLFVLALACRVRRVPLLLVCVGANEAPNVGLSGVFTRLTLRWARYVSYRDIPSERAHAALLPPARSAGVWPDIAFSLDRPTPTAATERPGEPDPRRVFVGVMRYYGVADDQVLGAATYDAYVTRISAFVADLVRRGYDVRVGIGDLVDADTAEAVALAGRLAAGPDAPGSVRAVLSRTVDELRAELAAARYVVGTRYHNIVLGLALGKPTLSVGYLPKNTALMADFGLEDYTQEIEDLDPERLVAQFDQLAREVDVVARQVRAHANDRRELLARQEKLLRDLLGDLPPVARVAQAARAARVAQARR